MYMYMSVGSIYSYTDTYASTQTYMYLNVRI
jgi:hypothetical protein